MHIMKMKITWDSVKAKSNRLKHRVFFSEVESVFYDPSAISVEDTGSQGEVRHVVIGRDSLDRLIVVVYAYRESVIRIISARKASKSERKIYEKELRF